MRISDWSSDVCSSDLGMVAVLGEGLQVERVDRLEIPGRRLVAVHDAEAHTLARHPGAFLADVFAVLVVHRGKEFVEVLPAAVVVPVVLRSEEHTSELQSLMRISYAVFCLKKQKINTK